MPELAPASSCIVHHDANHIACIGIPNAGAGLPRWQRRAAPMAAQGCPAGSAGLPRIMAGLPAGQPRIAAGQPRWQRRAASRAAPNGSRKKLTDTLIFSRYSRFSKLGRCMWGKVSRCCGFSVFRESSVGIYVSRRYLRYLRRRCSRSSWKVCKNIEKTFPKKYLLSFAGVEGSNYCNCCNLPRRGKRL